MSFSKGILKEVSSYQSSSKAMKEKIKKVEQGYFTVDNILHDHRIEYRKDKNAVHERLAGMEQDISSLENSIQTAANVALFQERKLEYLNNKLDRLTEYVSKLWTAVSVLSGIVAVMLVYLLWLIYYGI